MDGFGSGMYSATDSAVGSNNTKMICMVSEKQICKAKSFSGQRFDYISDHCQI